MSHWVMINNLYSSFQLRPNFISFYKTIRVSIRVAFWVDCFLPRIYQTAQLDLSMLVQVWWLRRCFDLFSSHSITFMFLSTWSCHCKRKLFLRFGPSSSITLSRVFRLKFGDLLSFNCSSFTQFIFLGLALRSILPTYGYLFTFWKAIRYT